MASTAAAYRNSCLSARTKSAESPFCSWPRLNTLRRQVAAWMVEVHEISPELADYHVSRMDFPELRRRVRMYAALELNTAESKRWSARSAVKPSRSSCAITITPPASFGATSAADAIAGWASSNVTPITTICATIPDESLGVAGVDGSTSTLKDFTNTCSEGDALRAGRRDAVGSQTGSTVDHSVPVPGAGQQAYNIRSKTGGLPVFCESPSPFTRLKVGGGVGGGAPDGVVRSNSAPGKSGSSGSAGTLIRGEGLGFEVFT